MPYAGWRYKTRLLIALGELHGKKGAHRKKALYFVNQALKTARRNGAAKHEAGALRVKAGIVHGNRPKMAHACLERAFELSAGIGARLLQQKIRETMVSLENP